MKRDFNAWLPRSGPRRPSSRSPSCASEQGAREEGAIQYGQTLLDASDALDLDKERAKYEEDRARDIRLGGTNGIDAAVKAHNLDALLFPGPSSASIASRPGYPTVLVPFGMIPNTPGNPGGRGGRGGAPGAAPATGTAATTTSTATTTAATATTTTPTTTAATRRRHPADSAARAVAPSGFRAKATLCVIFTGPACRSPSCAGGLLLSSDEETVPAGASWRRCHLANGECHCRLRISDDECRVQRSANLSPRSSHQSASTFANPLSAIDRSWRLPRRAVPRFSRWLGTSAQ